MSKCSKYICKYSTYSETTSPQIHVSGKLLLIFTGTAIVTSEVTAELHGKGAANCTSPSASYSSTIREKREPSLSTVQMAISQSFRDASQNTYSITKALQELKRHSHVNSKLKKLALEQKQTNLVYVEMTCAQIHVSGKLRRTATLSALPSFVTKRSAIIVVVICNEVSERLVANIGIGVVTGIIPKNSPEYTQLLSCLVSSKVNNIQDNIYLQAQKQ